MRFVARVAVALFAAAFLNGAPVKALTPAGPDGTDPAHLLLFASTDLWRHGGFAHSGLLWSPGGLDRDGFALKAAFGGGSYRYISGALGHADVDGRQLAGELLFGWRVVRGRLFLTTFAGFDFQQHRLQPDDPSGGLRGGYAGIRGGFELWYEPAPNAMVAAHAFVSSVGSSYSARLAAGWRMNRRYYLGPEVQGFAADNNYRQVRGGLHVTALRFGDWEWSAGLGWSSDSDNRGGLYGRLGVLTRK